MLHGNVSGRYGGCFEERYNEAYDDIAYHAKVLDAPVKYAPTPTRRAMHGTEQASKNGWWKCQLLNTYISPKNSCTYYH